MDRKLSNTIVAVDFDGTCVAHEYPRVGREIGAHAVLKRLTDAGARLILFTMRSGGELVDAVEWFAEKEIPLFGINENPEQLAWTTSPKPYAHLYIDDAALGCPLLDGLQGERPFVNWGLVEKKLFGDECANSLLSRRDVDITAKENQ